jgi:hypothetical protein
VSDTSQSRPFLGNFESSREQPERLHWHPYKRRLVEECEVVSVYAVQKAFGKKPLITAIRQARPFRLPVLGGYSDIWLVDEPHRLPGRNERWSSLERGTVRLWLICPGCRRKIAKLYYYFFAPGSPLRSDLLCRHCHDLTYQSVNCGGNRWYREVARPMKRLLRQRRRLLTRRCTPRVAAQLALIENLIRELRERAKPRTQHRTQNLRYGLAVRERRVYRNLALVDPEAAKMESICSAAEPDRSKLSVPRNKTDKSSISQPKKTIEQMWEEYRQSHVDMILQFRREGLITDEHLRRSPRLRRAIAALEREQKRTPNS